MARRTPRGDTYLDLAKIFIDNFLKARSRDSTSTQDRYMLFTFDSPPDNVKVGWHEGMSAFSKHLKDIRPIGFTALGPSLKNALDIINLNRLSTGMDTFAQGRYPSLTEVTLIIILTDNGKLTYPWGSQNELLLPMNNYCIGLELRQEPFSWDQRIFSIVFEMSKSNFIGNSSLTTIAQVPMAVRSPSNAMCAVTGGRSYLITSLRAMNITIESLVLKVRREVIVRFELQQIDTSPTSRHSLHLDSKYFAGSGDCKNNSVWPIPEHFFPTAQLESYPQRLSHPIIFISPVQTEEIRLEDVPEDVYPILESDITRHLVSTKSTGCVHQVYIKGSYLDQASFGFPFGYVKPDWADGTVTLHVLPYNYPLLCTLLQEVLSRPTPRNQLPEQWITRLHQYVQSIPGYYIPGLKRLFAKLTLPNCIPEMTEHSVSPRLQAYLHKVKLEAKKQFDSVKGVVDSCTLSKEFPPLHWNREELLNSIRGCGNIGTLDTSLVERISNPFRIFTSQPNDNGIHNRLSQRKNLLPFYEELRWYLQNPDRFDFVNKDAKHCAPVQVMGDFQNHSAFRTEPLRNIENQPVRQHIFGNPFKTAKVIDECDMVFEQQENSDSEADPTKSSSPASVLAEKRMKWLNFLHQSAEQPSDQSVENPKTTASSQDSSENQQKSNNDSPTVDFPLESDEQSQTRSIEDRRSNAPITKSGEIEESSKNIDIATDDAMDIEYLDEDDQESDNEDKVSVLPTESQIDLNPPAHIQQSPQKLVEPDCGVGVLCEDVHEIVEIESSSSSGSDSENRSDRESTISEDEEYWLAMDEHEVNEKPWWMDTECVQRLYDLSIECYRIIRAPLKVQQNLFRHIRVNVRPHMPKGSERCFIAKLKQCAMKFKSKWIADKLDTIGLRILLGSTDSTLLCPTSFVQCDMLDD